MSHRRFIAVLTTVAALAVPAAAQGHVTLQPKTAPAGGFARMDVRVPNERDNASTTKVELQLPDGFAEASYEPVSGWTVKVKKAKLAQPIKTDDGEVTEGVKQITWTSKDGIPPGRSRTSASRSRSPARTATR
jgi:periplasmic copper chaperone A